MNYGYRSKSLYRRGLNESVTPSGSTKIVMDKSSFKSNSDTPGYFLLCAKSVGSCLSRYFASKNKSLKSIEIYCDWTPRTGEEFYITFTFREPRVTEDFVRNADGNDVRGVYKGFFDEDDSFIEEYAQLVIDSGDYVEQQLKNRYPDFSFEFQDNESRPKAFIEKEGELVIENSMYLKEE